ncbi:SDR family oxidoreductase [Actinoplanes sp. TRM 88003]|uniref:SDR family oxidoreductase n=1 Tax=Paractinoplanes aksuensis TaxID=2939490 RepID=A0ABT1DI55_9ACTN|nr:SDR family oxidoreductase [Actinoplanes aksuensis]MCO8270464.1 SDR family oxidoreductase [Actinoplanes aksuensis]
MRIAVLGGTGLVGSRVVALLRERRHEAVPHGLSTGVDLQTGRGLPEALKDVDVVVNLSRPPVFDQNSPVFFRETMENLLQAAEDAEVGHIVILSVIGAEQVPDVHYYKGRVVQEEVLRDGDVPWSVIRSTDFFEFIDRVLTWTADDTAVRLPATLLQPIAADDVARIVAGVATTGSLDGVLEIAGPEVFPLDQLGRITLAARGDERPVVVDPTAAGMYSYVRGAALIAGDTAVLAETTYRQWLRG